MIRSLRAVTSCALLVGLVAYGCASDGGGSQTQANEQVLAPSGAADGFVVTLGTQPAPPAKGDNQVVVTVKRSDGTPLTEGKVTAVFSMPAMPGMNMPAMRTEASLLHAGDGRYRGTSQLSMGGTWNVALTISEGAKELATRQTSIVAKE